MRSFSIRILLPVVIAPAVFFGATGVRAIVPPRDGGPMPEGFRAAKEGRPDAFTMGHAWIARARAAGEARTGGGAGRTADGRTALIGPGPLAGTLRVPVVGARYSNYLEPPYDLSSLQMELFDGPWSTGTLRQYFTEASGGLFAVTGTVSGWVPLAQPENYYTGVYAQGLVPGVSKTDEMIAEAVAGVDAEVDFGQYDNDGPDGIPNSGDDDGFVDVLIVVHPSVGAECTNSLHMWSHSWQYSLWQEGGQPLPTDDPAAGGGVILVDDYIMAPLVSCEGHLIEIGVFCHELGHALGLPDLYDYNGGSSGIGHWGLMGSGNWNRPESPAHPTGWTKERLGWVDVVDIGWEPTDLTLGPVIGSHTVARMLLPTRRFRRMLPPASPTGEALVCGYTLAEAAGRGWPGEAGYGNEWEESIAREFVFDGTHPVSLEYDIQTDLEEAYDFAYTLLRIGSGLPDTIASLSGVNPLSTVSLDLDPFLPSGPVDVEISFVLRSDYNFSDEDGRYRSEEGRALLVDNIRITGGGIDYFADFTDHAGGWHETSSPAEYFIVERRTKTGFDAYLEGQGLIVWHAEPSTAFSYVGNSGGVSNVQARGLFVEEADGGFDLLKPSYDGGNQGDAGDPWPGSSGNRDFTSTSVPASLDNAGGTTPVSITGISAGSALFAAGMRIPRVDSITPDSVDVFGGGRFELAIAGADMAFHPTCALSRSNATVPAREVQWYGENLVVARFDSEELFAGDWDLVLTNGDGRPVTVEEGLSVRSRILLADVERGRSWLRPVWIVETQAGLRGSLLYRSDDGGPFTILTADTLRNTAGNFIYTDETVVPGVIYRYRTEVFYDDDSTELILPGEHSITEYPFIAFNPYPNPSNGRVTVSFFTPERRAVSVRMYDVAGRLVDEAADGAFPRGTHEIVWEPEPGSVVSGVYFAVVDWGRGRKVFKLVMIR